MKNMQKKPTHKNFFCLLQQLIDYKCETFYFIFGHHVDSQLFKLDSQQ